MDIAFWARNAFTAVHLVHASPNFVPLHGVQTLPSARKCSASHATTPLCVSAAAPAVAAHVPSVRRVVPSQMSHDAPSRHAAHPSWHAPHDSCCAKCPAPHFTTRLARATIASLGSPAPHVAPDRSASSAHRMRVAALTRQRRRQSITVPRVPLFFFWIVYNNYNKESFWKSNSEPNGTARAKNTIPAGKKGVKSHGSGFLIWKAFTRGKTFSSGNKLKTRFYCVFGKS